MLSGVKNAILHIECALNLQYYTQEEGRGGSGRVGIREEEGLGTGREGRKGKGEERERRGREGTVRGERKRQKGRGVERKGREEQIEGEENLSLESSNWFFFIW